MLKVVSLNIENDKHIELVLSFFKAQTADVILVQELFKKYIPRFQEELGMTATFAPLCKKIIDDKNNEEEWGIAIFSKVTPLKQHKLYYVGNKLELKLFDRNNQGQTRYKALLVVELLKENKKFTIATTHFTAATSKAATPSQRADITKLLHAAAIFPELILGGDFNSMRGGPIYTALATRYLDNIPLDITTTIDKNFHRDGGIQCVVDGLFTTREYEVNKIELKDGVSDHHAIVAEIDHR